MGKKNYARKFVEQQATKDFIKKDNKPAGKSKLRLKAPLDKRDFKLTVSRALNVEEIILESNCSEPFSCFINPCEIDSESCLSYPNADCIPNYCGDCHSDYYDLVKYSKKKKIDTIYSDKIN